MYEQWRFRPAQAAASTVASASASGSGSECPICATHHFPFCDPPLSLDHPGIRFPSVDPLRRFTHPFNHHPPAPPSFYDLRPPPSIRAPEPWEPSSRFYPSEFLHGEGLNKRMRIEDPVDNSPSYHRFITPEYSSNDARRISLIRDHGRQDAKLLDPMGNLGDHRFTPHGPPFSFPMPLADAVGDKGYKSFDGDRDFDDRRFYSSTREDKFASHFPDQGRVHQEQHFNEARHQNHHPGHMEEMLPVRNYLNFIDYAGSGSGSDYGMRSFFDKHAHSSELLKQKEYPISDTIPKPHPQIQLEDVEQVRTAQYGGDNDNRVCNSWRSDANQASFKAKNTILDDIHKWYEDQNSQTPEATGTWNNKQDDHVHVTDNCNSISKSTTVQDQSHAIISIQTLPSQPLPPEQRVEPSPQVFQDTLFPIITEPPSAVSDGLSAKRLSFAAATPSKQLPEEGRQLFSLRNNVKDIPTISTTVDAGNLFKIPHRYSRPGRFVIILRGIPGSGKSYLAKLLRDLEVENCGSTPRIHALDDYFMIEVEKKAEENEGSKFSVRGKRPITKKVIEYCYDPEMEEMYRSSMLKAFKKTLEEGVFTFIIVDDRNLRVADFAQFWAIAKRSGYEVYLLEAMYKDPTGCAARNVHGFTLEDIQKMADLWEDAPPLYMKLDVQSLIHGDNLSGQSIEEVDMDTDDADAGVNEPATLEDTKYKISPSASVDAENVCSAAENETFGEKWHVEDEIDLTEAKDLSRSKWSTDFDEDTGKSTAVKENINALSGLILTYGKSEKFVHWGDQVDKGGFSISAVKRRDLSSLIIGPGHGYNWKSNPLKEEENCNGGARSNDNSSDLKKRFNEQLRAERESFRSVFDRRRQRIAGIHNADDE